MKIAVIGYSGAGKSTLARLLGEHYGIPVLHFDTVHWAPGWQERDKTEAHQIVREFMKQPEWVIDGNYTKYEYQRRLAEADTIVFLALPRLSCFARAWKRYFRYKGKTRADMGEGCLEKMDPEFMKWLLWKGRGAQKKKWLDAGLKDHMQKVTFLRSQKEIDRYWEDLPC